MNTYEKILDQLQESIGSAEVAAAAGISVGKWTREHIFVALEGTKIKGG